MFRRVALGAAGAALALGLFAGCGDEEVVCTTELKFDSLSVSGTLPATAKSLTLCVKRGDTSAEKCASATLSVGTAETCNLTLTERAGATCTIGADGALTLNANFVGGGSMMTFTLTAKEDQDAEVASHTSTQARPVPAASSCGTSESFTWTLPAP